MSLIAENPAPAAEPADQPATTACATPAPVPAGITPEQAIDKCLTAYQRAYTAAAAKGEHISRCDQAGGHAFRLAMPSAGSLAEIQAFIACIIRGMHQEIWICNQARDLLCAARIAISAYKCESAKKKNVA